MTGRHGRSRSRSRSNSRDRRRSRSRDRGGRPSHDRLDHRRRSPSREDRRRSPLREDRRPRSPPRRPRSPTSSFLRRREEELVDESKYVYGRPSQNVADAEAEPSEPAAPKETANFGLSGRLAAESNTLNGIVLKYSEPPEARIPTRRWRLYVFKNGEQIEVLHLHRQSGYLLGKERAVVDIPLDHPSCSKQHAVVQFRLVNLPDSRTTVKPYLIDLGSTNGTFLNGDRMDAQRYYELKEKDRLTFGSSSRNYVLLHEDMA